MTAEPETTHRRVLAGFLALVLVWVTPIAYSTEAEELVVVTEHLPPYSYQENGEIVGLSTELVRQILDEAGLNYRILLAPWTRAYQMAEKDAEGKVLIYSMTRTDQREDLFHWLHRLAKGELILFSRNGIPPTSEANIRASKDSAVCVYEDASCDWLRSIGFTDERLFEVADIEGSSEIQMTLAGRVTFFAANPISLQQRLQDLKIPPDQVQAHSVTRQGKGLYLAASKSVSLANRKRINQAIERMQQRKLPIEIHSSVQFRGMR